jgi:hypothetical protein
VPSLQAIYLQTNSIAYPPSSLNGIVGLTIGDSYLETDVGSITSDPVGRLDMLMGRRALKLAGIRYPQDFGLPSADYAVGQVASAANSTSTSFSVPVALAYGANPTYLAALNPSVVVFTNGFNDTGATSIAAVQAAALASWQQARALWPNAPIIIFGPMLGSKNGGSGPPTIASVEAALTAAYAQWGDTNSFFHPVWGALPGPWWTGTYCYGSSSGTAGASSWIIGGDCTHPNVWGHEYISQRMASQIDADLKSIGM